MLSMKECRGMNRMGCLKFWQPGKDAVVRHQTSIPCGNISFRFSMVFSQFIFCQILAEDPNEIAWHRPYGAELKTDRC